ncbi:WD repeat-containing protein 38 [Mesocricetus auratus]|uniref:WD repeat-containing protein 38 n=1 Tax=Mesocricetus auratus TaxID=10036 RepID=A0ABM2WL55_MESAU|nr:WD repeat-containing protein 38 [Mesocricetus auratus]
MALVELAQVLGYGFSSQSEASDSNQQLQRAAVEWAQRETHVGQVRMCGGEEGVTPGGQGPVRTSHSQSSGACGDDPEAFLALWEEVHTQVWLPKVLLTAALCPDHENMELTSALQSEQHVKKELRSWGSRRRLGELKERLLCSGSCSAAGRAVLRPHCPAPPPVTSKVFLTRVFQAGGSESSLSVAARPAPLPWRLLVHSFLFPSTLPRGPSDGTGARLGGSRSCPGLQRAPMNIKAPTRLAVGRVRFFGQHRGEVNCSAFSPDGRTLLTASDDGHVYVWETKSRRLLWRMAGHRGPVKFCRFSPDGRLVASSSCDRTVRLWDLARFKCLHVLKGHQRSVETVSFSPDSKQLASGGWDRKVILWEVQSGHNVRPLIGHRDSVQSSDFSPTADSLATGSWDSTVHIWDLRVAAPVTSYQELEGHTGNISCLCYSASGLLASGSWDKTIRIWNPTTNSLLFQLKGHATWVRSLAFSPDELRLASAGYSRMVKVWDCNTGECLETLKGLLDVAHACVFTPDGKLLVSGAAVTR